MTTSTERTLAKSTLCHFSHFQNQMIEENGVLFFGIATSGSVVGTSVSAATLTPTPTPRGHSEVQAEESLTGST